jgi:DNA-binding MarR family transcriptional regulator
MALAKPTTNSRTQAPSGCSNLKLRQAARLSTRHYAAHLAPLGLKITQYSLLSHVVKLGPIAAGELAAAMQLSPSALSRNLQPLMAQGWLEQQGGDDGRCRIVVATAAGQALRDRAQRAWKRAQLDFNALLGEDRVARLHTLLDECVALLGSAGSEADESES